MTSRKWGEGVKKKLSRFGKKNFFCFLIALPAILFTSLFFGLCGLVAGNAKKLCMTLVSLLFVAVFSSFSFTGLGGSRAALAVIDFGAMDESISLAEESEEALSGQGDAAGEDGVTELELEGEDLNGVFTAESILREAGYFRDAEGTAQEDPEAGSASEQPGWPERGDAEDSGEGEIPDGLGAESEGMLSVGELLGGLETGETPGETARDPFTPVYEDYSSYVFDRDDWRLILVSKQHYIPEDYDFPLGTITGYFQCDERIIESLYAMLGDARQDGCNLVIRSPYRSNQNQYINFRDHVAKFMGQGMTYMDAYKTSSFAVNPPGTSEHQIGLAIDITSDSWLYLSEGFADTREGKWLAANCHRYGFILRYPKDKEYITMIEFEPWHFRYVGIEAANYIMANDLTLEEFWEETF